MATVYIAEKPRRVGKSHQNTTATQTPTFSHESLLALNMVGTVHPTPPIGATAQVRRQYEDFPYPTRDPADEAERLVATFLDDLAAVNQYCFAGRREFSKGFRALVAGGGTGDAAIYLAHQLRDLGGEVVHLDLSERAIEIARRRAERRGLADHIAWIHDSLLELPRLGLGTFDYINCSGVLHHLESPTAGLAALRSVLKPDGALGLMVYGRYGRTGVYQVQELLRRITAGESDLSKKLSLARRIYDTLPETNWFRRGSDLFGETKDDAELVDMFLHPRDRAYSVPELYELLGGAGLQLAAFPVDHRFAYDPAIVIGDPALLDEIRRRPLPQQQAIAELAGGTITKHTFWATPQPPAAIDGSDLDHVPLWSFYAISQEYPAKIRDWTKPVFAIRVERDYYVIKIEINMTTVARQFFDLMDGARTLGEIALSISADDPHTDIEAAADECRSIVKAFSAYDLMLLRHKSSPPLAA